MLALFLFIFGFGVGALILELIFFKKIKDLKLEKEGLMTEIKTLNADIKHLKERLSIYIHYFAADAREFKIIENFDSFDVVLKIIRIIPYKEEDILIKRFYFKDDIEYAKLCAQELLDALNNTN